MDVQVLLSSGDSDQWVDVADTIEQHGALLIVDRVDGDATDDVKTITVAQQGPDPAAPAEWQTFAVVAHYAPGMWMRAEYGGA